MKKLFILMAIALTIVAAAPRENPADTKIVGAWKVVRAQYGSEPMQDFGKDDLSYKMFTGTRWSGAFYNRATKKFDGAGGGSYTIKGDQYTEKIEYYSWDSEVVGKTFTFTLKMENGMLHQSGTIVYKDNSNYIIDEWFERVD